MSPLVVKRALLGLLLLSALGGCTILRQSQSLNKRFHVSQELKRIEGEMLRDMPSGEVPKTLYLYDEKGCYQDELAELLSLDPTSSRLALLMGDGEALLQLAKDTLLLVNAYLLMGHAAEAERLLGQWSTPDLPLQAIVVLNRTDTVGCVSLLREIVEQGDKLIAPRAARLWSHLKPQDKVPLEYLSAKSPSRWERFTATACLGEVRAESPEELAYVAVQKALTTLDTLSLREATTQLQAVAGSEWRRDALLALRPLLYGQGMWVEALAVQEALPEEYQKDFPYSLLIAYSSEIDLLRRYLAPPQGVGVAPATLSADDSFRAKWGNVQNVDNWVMVQSMGFRSERYAATRPSEKEYQAVLTHLNTVMPKLISASSND